MDEAMKDVHEPAPEYYSVKHSSKIFLVIGILLILSNLIEGGGFANGSDWETVAYNVWVVVSYILGVALIIVGIRKIVKGKYRWW